MTGGRWNQSTSALSEAEWQARCALFGNVCAYCGKPPALGALWVEHVEPLSRGGSDTVDNLVPVCHACNSWKSDLLLLEWVCVRHELLAGRTRRNLRPGTRHETQYAQRVRRLRALSLKRGVSQETILNDLVREAAAREGIN